MFKSIVAAECASESIVAEALKKHIIDLAIRQKDASMFWESDIEEALSVYALAWATHHGMRKPEWFEEHNELDEQRIQDVEKDLGFIARHLCVTLPSSKGGDGSKYNLPSSVDEEDDGFKW